MAARSTRKTEEPVDAEVVTEDTETTVAVPPMDEKWAALAAPFPEDEIELLAKTVGAYNKNAPKYQCKQGTKASVDGVYCGGFHAESFHLHYIGHAGITTRLTRVDPEWNWEPVAVDQYGQPLIINGGMWIRLTVLGVTRLGYGDAGRSQGHNATKEIIGDALRNAAMRFGVGTYLWSKSEAAERLKRGQFEDEAPESIPEVQDAPPPAAPPTQPQPAPAQPQEPQTPAGFTPEQHATAQRAANDAWNNPTQLRSLRAWYANQPNTPPDYLQHLDNRIASFTEGNPA